MKKTKWVIGINGEIIRSFRNKADWIEWMTLHCDEACRELVECMSGEDGKDLWIGEVKASEEV